MAVVRDPPDSGIYSSEISVLFKEHLEHLQKSAISLDVIRERGYRSIFGKSQEFEHLGFRKNQRRTGILIPVYGVEGSIVYYRLRPDNPRKNDGEKPIKYEQPANTSVRFDIPPRCRESLANPKIPLIITEGEKKVDSLVSAGACAIGLPGVWNWKGKNPFGGSTILADFDCVAWNDRLVYIVFDSDAWSNPRVAQAWERLKGVLSNRHAQVRNLKLPDGPEGKKLGVDDYFSQGHTLQELIGLEIAVDPRSSLRKRSADTYCVEEGRYCFVKQSVDGESVIPLCNFTAAAVEDITRDNGQETVRYFKVSGRLYNGRDLPVVEVPSAQFNSLNWVTGEWGMRAIIAAGQNNKDRLREAIQLQSQEALQKTVYTHTGWRKVNEEMTFLNAAGALGNPSIQVEMDPALSRYSLPEPEGDPLEAIKASYNFLFIGKLEVSIPFLAAMYLAPLSELLEPAFTIWLVGPSGSFKSTITALALCHFGNFDTLHLPASWRDTANQLEKLLFLAKDMPIVIDDWAPGQDSAKAREMEVKAEYIIRAQGNHQGRGRMRSDTSSRPSYTPRGVLITSGEQLPSGHSHTARIYSVEVEREDIDLATLTEAQNHRQLYRVSMAHYILWLKLHYPELQKSLKTTCETYRDKAQKSDMHPRLPAAIGWLYTGLVLFCDFALEMKALTLAETEALLTDGWRIFLQQAMEQSERVEEERPGTIFLESLISLRDAGKVNFVEKNSTEPTAPIPGTSTIGWKDGAEFLYLNPSVAYAAVHDHSLHSGIPLTFKEAAVWKDMKRLGYTDCQDGRTTNLLWVYGESKRVIKLKLSSFNIFKIKSRRGYV